MNENSRKRSADQMETVISVLAIPESKTTVSEIFSNDKNQATEVQAYAKIAGNNWTYYVKSLSILIGRNTEVQNTHTEDGKDSIHIDLGPAKVVSRQHASINYNLETRIWQLVVWGRNGAKVDGMKVTCGPHAVPTPLHSGSVIDIGGTQMMFILPESTPEIAQEVLNTLGSKLPKPKAKKTAASYLPHSLANTNIKVDINTGNFNGPNGSLNNRNDGFITGNNLSTLKGFQMFSKEQANSNDFASGLNASGIDNDLSKDDSRDIKPPYSYATMITQAILSNTEGVLSLSEIYDWIARHYAFYRFSKSGWQNSIRHNLSLNKAFEKVPRRANEPGKGMKWQISESYRSEFLKKFQSGSLSKVRRGSSVSRQLQLHLATHNDLPQSQKGNISSAPQSNISTPVHQSYVPINHNQFQYPTQHSNPQFKQTQKPLEIVNSNSHDSMNFLAQSAQINPPNSNQRPQQPVQNFSYNQLPPLQPQSHQQHNHATNQEFLHSRAVSNESNNQFQEYAVSQNNSQQQLHPHSQPLHSGLPNPPSLHREQNFHENTKEKHSIRPITQDSSISTDRTEILKPSSSQQQQQVPPSSAPNPATSQSLPRQKQQEQQQQHQQEQPHDHNSNEQEQQHFSSPTKQESNARSLKTTPPPQKLQKPYFHNNNNNANDTTAETKDSNFELGMITSPTKSFSISAVEAYTPERGTRKKSDQQSHPGGQGLQSSPALWNFVQFSTPLQGGEKNGSPTKNHPNYLPDSPLHLKQKENIGDLRNIDLAKGFKK
ncbi:hypothetical protein WICMUC_001714 [Wickerhamomyces mucosus]|uniref:Uncharacterized protein n=1 Tax=Wickerhamomyces mucosus TaxID=1378264 RepID=A0A9P8TG47_9ASCO|nr:hypothetical protein WICMUC_001714 [Wickerhamomyces mucosus]